VFRQSIEQGVGKVNLLYGKAAWQSRWGAKPETTEVRTLLLSRRPGSLLRAAIYGVRREIHACVRRSAFLRRFEFLWSAGSLMHYHGAIVRATSHPLVTMHLVRAHR